MPEQSKAHETKEPSIFPISREVVDTVLKRIEGDPDMAFKEEHKFMSDEFFFRMERISGAVSVDEGCREFLVGAIYLHAFLREQALQRGVTLPIFPKGYGAPRRGDESIFKEDESLEEMNKRRWNILSKEEPELERGLRQIVKYWPERVLFYGGVTEAYRMFRSYSEIQDFEAARFGKIG